MPSTVPLLGRIALQHKLVTAAQIKEALAIAAGDNSRLGEALVKSGFINTAQLNALVRKQDEMIANHRAKQAAARGAHQTAAPAAKPAPESVSAGPVPVRSVEAPSSPPPAPAPVAPERSPAPAPAAAVRTATHAITTAPETPPPDPTPSTARSPEALPSAPASAASQPAKPAAHVVETHAPSLAEPSEADAEKLTSILKDAVAKGASDIHIHSGAGLRFRVHGEMEMQGAGILEAGETERLLASALPAPDRALLAERGELDFCYQVDGVGRFRANFYRQQRGYDAVFRSIPPQPPTFEELGLPESLAKHTHYHQGMVLVTGPTGCGKSSTLAALVNLINEERDEHILTIEDPIEFVHTSKRCLVNQRSVNRHTESFGRALRAALREDPDVIVIGELRDYETISLALTAAETGHFVLGTLHTNSTIRTVNRLVGVFPSDQQGQVRNMLSESLRAVISQRLIPRANGEGRVPAIETLVITRAVGNLIRDNKTFQIHSVLQTGAAQGMGLLDHSIRSLVESGDVELEEALRHCIDPRAIGA